MSLDLPDVGWTPEDGDKEELSQRVMEILTDKAEMLKEYFSMDIDQDGNLNTLPLILGKEKILFSISNLVVYADF